MKKLNPLSPTVLERFTALLGHTPSAAELSIAELMWSPTVSQIGIWNELKRIPQHNNSRHALTGIHRTEVSETQELCVEIFAGKAANEPHITALDLNRAEKIILQSVNLDRPVKSKFQNSQQWKLPAESQMTNAILHTVGLIDTERTYFSQLMAPGEVIMLVVPKATRHFSEISATFTSSARQSTRKLLADEQLLENARGTALVENEVLLPAILRLTEGSKFGLRINPDLWPLMLRSEAWDKVLLKTPVAGLMLTLAADLESACRRILEDYDLIGLRLATSTNDQTLSLVIADQVIANIPAAILLPAGGMSITETTGKPGRKFEKTESLDYESLAEPPDYNDALIQVLNSPRVQPFALLTDDNSKRMLELPLLSRFKTTQGLTVVSALASFPIIVQMNPQRAAEMAAATATRQLVCSGADPKCLSLAIFTPDLEDEENFLQFQSVITGISSAATVLNLPVIARQVVPSEKLNVVVGAVGNPEENRRSYSMRFRDEGDFIVMLGTLKGELGGGVYLETILGSLGTDAPELDMVFEDRVQRVAREATQDGIIKSMTTLGPGGLSSSMALACIADPENLLGCEIYIHRKFRDDQLLFGESQSVIIVTLHEKHLLALEKITQLNQVPSATIGRVRGDRFIVNEQINLSLKDMQTALNWPAKR